MCSKWLFHFLAEKQLWIPNRFSAKLFHDFGKRGRGNREPRRPRMERTPFAACTHACQAPSAPASRFPFKRTRVTYASPIQGFRAAPARDYDARSTTPEHEIEARNSRHTKLKPATPHNEIEARNSQHTKLKSATPENEIEVRNS